MTKEPVAKLSGFDYEYTGALEGAVPGVGLVERGQTITPTHPEHEQVIKDSGLFKRVARAEGKAEARAKDKTADGGKEG